MRPINSWPTIKPSGLYSEEPPITPYVPVTTKPTAYVFDVDGNEYIDLRMGYGPAILGHGDDRVARRQFADIGA